MTPSAANMCIVCRRYWGSCETGGQFNIKMTSYQYGKSHCGDKTILRPSYLHNGISYTGKMTSLYWIRALEASTIQCGAVVTQSIFSQIFTKDTPKHLRKVVSWLHDCIILGFSQSLMVPPQGYPIAHLVVVVTLFPSKDTSVNQNTLMFCWWSPEKPKAYLAGNQKSGRDRLSTGAADQIHGFMNPREWPAQPSSGDRLHQRARQPPAVRTDPLEHNSLQVRTHDRQPHLAEHSKLRVYVCYSTTH